jgi:hypothetical protein
VLRQGLEKNIRTIPERVHTLPVEQTPKHAGESGIFGQNLSVIQPSGAAIPQEVLEGLAAGGAHPETIFVRADSGLADIVAAHTVRILQADYAKDLGAQDFYHGHLLVDTGNCDEGFDNYPRMFPRVLQREEWVNLILRSSPHFLYHTREKQHEQWQKERRPRSVIGTPDGEIHPATADTAMYREYGTVESEDAFTFSGTIHRMCSPVDKVELGQGLHLDHSDGAQFYILPDKNGRYSLPNDLAFDVFYAPFASGL